MPAERIASLLASSTEILYGLGLGNRIVAISHECDYPAEVRSRPRVTFTRIAAEASSRQIDAEVRGTLVGGDALYGVDAETLERLQPDLIVTQAQCDVCAVRYQDVQDAVTSSAVLRGTPIVSLNPNTIDEVFRDIAAVAAAAGVPERATGYVGALRKRVDRVRAAARNASRRPRVVCVEWVDPLMVAANWTPELVEHAGGEYGLAQSGVHTGYTNWQDVVDYRPEILIVAPCGFDLPRARRELPLLEALPGWRSLPAAQSRRVFVCDGNAYFNRSGPRLIDTLELLAYLIQPEIFPVPAWMDSGAPVFESCYAC